MKFTTAIYTGATAALLSVFLFRIIRRITGIEDAGARDRAFRDKTKGKQYTNVHDMLSDMLGKDVADRMFPDKSMEVPE